MITTDQALRIQARLDGELDATESAALDCVLQQDPEARALLEELTQTRLAVRGNEPTRTLPESREFYWSKIARAIERQETAATPRPAHSTSWWVRLAASLAGCTAVALVLFSVSRLGVSVLPTSPAPTAGAVDSILDDTATITFRSEAEGLTVVWVTSN